MKHITNSFIVMLLCHVGNLYADTITYAEDHAEQFSKSYSYEIGKELGITFYDGPYDGELSVVICEVNPVPGCLNYVDVDVQATVSRITSDNTNSEIEKYIYYHAFRNVYAGFYQSSEYNEYIKQSDIGQLIALEVYYIKSGARPITFMAVNPEWEGVVQGAKEAYPNE